MVERSSHRNPIPTAESPALLDPRIVGVVDKELGGVEGEADVGIDGDGLIAPLDVGQGLSTRVPTQVLPASGQPVSFADLPLEVEGRDGLTAPEIEVVLEVEDTADIQFVFVEPDGGAHADPTELGLEAELVKKRLVAALGFGRRGNCQDQSTDHNCE